MEKLTDEELDSVFKNAAEGNTPPYDAAAWDRFSQKLDAPRLVPLWKKWSPFILVAAFLFLTGVWVGRTSNKEDQPQLKNTSDVALLNERAAKQRQNVEMKTETGEEVNKVRVQPEAELIKRVGNTNDHQQKLQRKKPSDVVTIPLKIDETTEAIEEVVKPNVEPFFNQEQKIIVEPILHAAVKTDSSLQISKSNDTTEISKELADKPGGRRVYGLFIRLLASPDLSSIKFGPAELGSNFGVVGEFSLSEKFSLSTGVIRARKNYESYQEEAYANSARHLVGNCTILDVPLNVTYYFPSERKLSGYVTAGASSYLMLREDYIYTIKSSSGDRVYPYEAVRKNNEWFKVLNVALGLQYQLTQHWHIQLEPFIKAPLADLGERNVRLSSMGIFTGLRYKLHSKTKHP
jgi:hypothetical protein